MAGGESVAFGEYEPGTATECCLDDPNEFSVVSYQESVAHNSCCNLASDCVDFDGTCIPHGQHSQRSSSTGEVDLSPSLKNAKDYLCVNTLWWPKLYGALTNVTDHRLDRILVNTSRLSTGTSDTNITDSSGEYLTYLPSDTYHVIASNQSRNYHPGEEPYQDGITLNLLLDKPTRLDFQLFRPSTGCNADCTKADGLCHADCHGKRFCANFPQNLQTVCDLSAPGTVNLGGTYSLCCTGDASSTYDTVRAEVDICGDNVVSHTRPVFLSGQLVNMVVTVFEPDDASCE